MFQNKRIAEDHGRGVEAANLEKGVSPAQAKRKGQEAAKIKEAALNKWTKDNVGLN